MVEVQTTGNGPDLVIIHSLLTGPEAFSEVAESLAVHHTIHRIYLPGFGCSSELLTQDPSISDFADLVAAVIARLGCGPRTTILGNGLGAFIALTMAIDHGDAFGPLIVSNVGTGFSAERSAALVDMNRLAERGGMQAVADVALQRIFPATFLESNPTALVRRRDVLESIAPRAFAAACRALATLDLSDDITRIDRATLVIAGAIDQTTPPEMAHIVAEGIPGAQIVVIPECGHCPQLEQPAALLLALEEFLNIHSSQQ